MNTADDDELKKYESKIRIFWYQEIARKYRRGFVNKDNDDLSVDIRDIIRRLRIKKTY